jgi:uncharacterized membrane protein YbhN (UPF0104 family)
MDEFRFRRRRVLLVLALAIGGTAILILVVGPAVHYATLIKRLQGASPGWLVLCGVGEALAYAGFIVSYRAVAQMSGGPRLPAFVAARVVGLSFGAFSVATTVGGLTVDFWALREAGEPPDRAGARVIALETLRWALLGIATWIASVLVLSGILNGPSWPAPTAWLVVVPLCVAGGAWISAPKRRSRFINAKSRIRRALGVAVAALALLRELMSGPSGLRLRAIAGGAVYWAGDILCAWSALRSFGAGVSLVPLLIGYTTGYVAEALPLPAGGSGGLEAAMTGGFVLAGAPLSGALLGAITFRVFTFWLPAIPALVSVLTVRSLRHRLEEIAVRRREPAAS